MVLKNWVLRIRWLVKSGMIFAVFLSLGFDRHVQMPIILLE